MYASTHTSNKELLVDRNIRVGFSPSIPNLATLSKVMPPVPGALSLLGPSPNVLLNYRQSLVGAGRYQNQVEIGVPYHGVQGASEIWLLSPPLETLSCAIAMHVEPHENSGPIIKNWVSVSSTLIEELLLNG
jgi:hypothetical protein